VSHDTPQVLPEQVGIPMDGAGHALLQAPQLSGSRVKSTHAPEHAVSVPGQALPHPVGVQTWFTPQAAPQAPQFAGSAFVLTQSVPHFV